MSTYWCHVCGDLCKLDESGVSHHVNEDGDTDYDQDADHVAVPDGDDTYISPTDLPGNPWPSLFDED